jgi:hypothetical protein
MQRHHGRELTVMEDMTAQEVWPRAQSALAASPVFDLRDVQVEQHETGLVLSGHVSSFYHKQLAQEVVRLVAGEVTVVNSIDVG